MAGVMKRVDRSNLEPWRQRLGSVVDKRILSGLEITKASEEVGKSRDYISNLVNSTKSNPPVELFIKICEKLGVSPAYIIDGDDTSVLREEIVKLVLEADSRTLERLGQVLEWAEADRESELQKQLPAPSDDQSAPREPSDT